MSFDTLIDAMYNKALESLSAARFRLTGLDNYDDLTATPIVVSDNGLIKRGTALTIQDAATIAAE